MGAPPVADAPSVGRVGAAICRPGVRSAPMPKGIPKSEVPVGRIISAPTFGAEYPNGMYGNSGVRGGRMTKEILERMRLGFLSA